MLHQTTTPKRVGNRLQKKATGGLNELSSDKQKSQKKIALAKDVMSLRQTIARLDGEISELDSVLCAEDLQVHMDALHEYNEVKDMGQMLLGKIAEMDGTTTKRLYERMGIDFDD